MRVGVWFFLYFLVVLVSAFFNYMGIYMHGATNYKWVSSFILVILIETIKLYIPIGYYVKELAKKASKWKIAIEFILWLALTSISGFTIFKGAVDTIRFHFVAPEFLSIEEISWLLSALVTCSTLILGIGIFTFRYRLKKNEKKSSAYYWR